MLAIYCENDQRQRDEYLPQLNKMVFGREVTLPVEEYTGSPNSFTDNDVNNGHSKPIGITK
ncbi:hypothetical protein DPMN_188728 [Dreissena polymorpha]|uniref:Uncharacterized protein n=1 Tax=Dreissena polymorpha TaxID=45954 RepID=A0A9D4DUB0_DREPO|nr:hypothetical protein DPMN_188728 [Dreissena polymorpha]